METRRSTWTILAVIAVAAVVASFSNTGATGKYYARGGQDFDDFSGFGQRGSTGAAMGNQAHTVCNHQTMTCDIIQGAGQNECANDRWCYRKTCVKQNGLGQCVEVFNDAGKYGAPKDSCSIDIDCR